MERTYRRGVWGYQSTPIPESPNPDAAFPFLHVGARYYDPSSGRFLQRDPIGIRGGTNVYAYVGSAPSARTDPSGLVDQNWEPPWGIPPKLPLPPPKTPGKIVEEVNNEGNRRGAGDKWRHYKVSRRVTEEVPLGPFIILPGGFAQEVWDVLERGDWWDSGTDMLFNIWGWWDGLCGNPDPWE